MFKASFCFMDKISLNKNYLLQVTNELYRITLLFPKKEPLRYKMRQLSNEVLANFVNLSKEKDLQEEVRIIEDSNYRIEVLDGYFDIARAQNWVRPSDILGLQREYSSIKEGFLGVNDGNERQERVQVIVNTPVNVPIPVHVPIPERPAKKEIKKKEVILTGRQEKILRILEEKDKAQVSDIKDYFPDISKRTLRRDLNGLLDYALINRGGERNSTFYEMSSA